MKEFLAALQIGFIMFATAMCGASWESDGKTRADPFSRR